MKRFLTILLAVFLTGCSTASPAPDPTEVPVPMTSASVTEITDGSQPVPTTELPVIPTVPPADDPESMAKRFLCDVLVPNYGISQDVTFEQVSEGGLGEVLPPPSAAEGIISAVVRDFTGDDTPELVTVREKDWSYILDSYTLLDDGYALSGTYTICTGDDMTLHFPKVSIRDGHILVRQNWFAVPGYSRYGNGLTILGVSQHGFSVQGDFWGSRYPGNLFLSVDSHDFTYEENSDTYDSIDFCRTAAEALDTLNMKYSALSAGWMDDGSFGIRILFDDEEEVFRVDQDSEGISRFVDSSGLDVLLN